MVGRQFFISSVMALTLGSGVASASANDLPTQLADARDKFYSFLLYIAQGNGLADGQYLVVNNTITPLDLASDTPYYNQELFRLYADHVYSKSYDSIQPRSSFAQADRFSIIYGGLIDIAAAKVDQSHSEIADAINRLQKDLKAAQQAYVDRDGQFEQQWKTVAEGRHLNQGTPGTQDYQNYTVQRIAWFEQVRYSDTMRSFTDAIDTVNAQIDALRRSKYTPSEMALLDDKNALSSDRFVSRPISATIERSWKPPLTDGFLADPHNRATAFFDSSTFIMPMGDLNSFLKKSESKTFSSSSYNATIDSGQKSWSASGSAGFFGWSLGGGGTGSASFRNAMSSLSSITIEFPAVAEYYIDRSAWLDPGVLRDVATLKLIGSLPQLVSMQYLCDSLILVRGTKMTLTFSSSVTASDWSKSAFSARGGASFLGFSFGASGGSSTTSSHFGVSQNGTTVTIADDDDVVRIIGARVEPFLAVPSSAIQATRDLVSLKPAFEKTLKDLRAGAIGGIQFQTAKIKALRE